MPVCIVCLQRLPVLILDVATIPYSMFVVRSSAQQPKLLQGFYLLPSPAQNPPRTACLVLQREL